MDRSEQLKSKYAPVLKVIEGLGASVKLTNVHVQNDKLVVRGAAATDAVKNQIWDAIKAVDATYGDLSADITVDASLPAPVQTYTVQAGDSLSKISKAVYGDTSKYLTIFEANRDQLSDPNVIRPGQTLKIPAA